MIALALATLAALTGELPFETSSAGAPVELEDAPHTRAMLIASVDRAVPGEPFDVAIVLRSEPGWHTYWKNPGDAGMATAVEWRLPKGWRAGELAWPAPQRFQEKEVTTFGYEGELWLIARVDPAKKIEASTTLGARVDWLECREVCLPGSAELTIEIISATK